MKSLFSSAIAIFALILPGAAFANVMGTPTLNSGQTLSLDTGTSSGTQDILFTGTAISFQGSARGLNLSSFGISGSSTFTSLTGVGSSAFSSFSSEFSSASITPLTAGMIIAYTTNGGNTGALLVNTVTSASLNIQFVTFESTTPTITAVLNNYSNIPPGFTNSGIAPGTLFIIKGSKLANTTAFVLAQIFQNAGSPLTTSLNGASVSVTVGSTTVSPGLYYAGASQLALVMPSNTPTGAGTVTVAVTGLGSSNSFSITVVASAFGMLSADQTGEGQVKAVNPNDAANPYISFTNSAQPGKLVSIYGSGMGADPTRDTTFTQTSNFPFTINALSAVYVGGVKAQIQYQGASGYPGLNQLNIVLDPTTPTGCFVSVAGVTAAGTATNFLTLPVGNGVCQDPGLGYNGSTLTSLSGQTNVRSGFVGLGYITSPNDTGSGTQVTADAFAVFSQYTGSGYGSSYDSVVSIGGCTVLESLGSGGSSTGTSTPLNPGTITVSSPNAGISPVQLTGNSFLAGYFEAQLPSGFLTQAGGTFPFSATAGTTAPAVGAFNTQVVFPTPLLTWTNQAADGTVVRASGVTVTWSSGSPGTYVTISGSSSNLSTYGSFSCLAPVAAGTFTVPPYVLATLPASASGVPGSLSIANYTVPQTFTATGLDNASAEGYVSYQINAVYQ